MRHLQLITSTPETKVKWKHTFMTTADKWEFEWEKNMHLVYLSILLNWPNPSLFESFNFPILDLYYIWTYTPIRLLGHHK